MTLQPRSDAANLRLCVALKLEAHGQLRLARIAHTHTQEAVEVEKRGCDEGVNVVLVIESVEYLNRRGQRITVSKLKGPRGAPVERNVFIVLPARVAFTAGTVQGLWRMSLEARIEVESAG